MTQQLDRKNAPLFQQVKNIDFLQAQTSSLDNGVKVHSLSGGSQEIVKIDFIFQAGSWFQQKPLVAKATSQLIKEGTKNYSSHEIAEGIDLYGAFLETETAYDQASITLYTLTKHLNKVLPFVYDVIINPIFSKNEFDIYKDNALEKFKVNQEKVSFVARQEFTTRLFGNSPYGMIPKENDFKNLSLDDIKQFYHNQYNLGNCEIIISGKVEPIVLTKLNDFFGKENITNQSTTIKPSQSIVPDKFKCLIEKKGALQSAIRIGGIIPNKLHPDYFGLKVLNTILGGYFGSRLMKNIREDKGYTYGIGSGIVSLKNTGYFFISTEVGSDVTSSALKEIYFEIEQLRKEKITNEELQLVKNYMLGQLLKSCDGPFNMASLFENVNTFGLTYDFYNHYIKTIKEINADQLMQLAINYLNPDQLNEVIVGTSN